MLQHNSSPCAK
jgi:hypothetical protein